MTRHFLDVDDLDAEELNAVLEAATIPVHELPKLLCERGVALLFEKPSLRTRSSMEANRSRNVFSNWKVYSFTL